MVCPYCTTKLHVSNSRPQKRTNTVWRRRHCPNCHAILTTVEQIDFAQSLQFISDKNHVEPFSRAKLLISLYEACKHRKHAEEAAEALTDTVMQHLKPVIRSAAIQRAEVVTCVQKVLKNFDHAAATAYTAYHTL